MDYARDAEAHLLQRCAEMARGRALAPADPREANLLRVPVMLLQPRRPELAQRLMAASISYLNRHPGTELPNDEVVRRGWIISLPRLREELERACRVV